MRNPEDPGWPIRGERTEHRDIAEEWKWRYLRAATDDRRRRLLNLGPAPRSLREAVEAFLDHREVTVQRATYGGDHTAMGHLLRHFNGSLAVESIEAHEVQALFSHLVDKGYKPTTLRTYLKAVSVFFRWYGSYDPSARVELPDPGKRDVVTWTDEEVERIREAADVVTQQQPGSPSARLAVEIGLNMGLRQSEIFALHREWVSSKHKTARIQLQVERDRRRLKPLKGKHARTAHILPDYWAFHEPGFGLMLPAQDGGPVASKSQWQMITRVLDTAGLNSIGAGWHSLRHTYARRYIECGSEIQHLQMSLGHASIATTEREYGHFRADSAAELARLRIYGK